MTRKNYPIIPDDIPGSMAMRALDDTSRAFYYELVSQADAYGVVYLDTLTLVSLCGLASRSPETVLRALMCCARVGLLYICEEDCNRSKHTRLEKDVKTWVQVGRWEEMRRGTFKPRGRNTPGAPWRPVQTEKTEVDVNDLEPWLRGWGERHSISRTVLLLALDPEARLIRTREAIVKPSPKVVQAQRLPRSSDSFEGCSPVAPLSESSSRGLEEPTLFPEDAEREAERDAAASPGGGEGGGNPPLSLPPTDGPKGTNGEEDRQGTPYVNASEADAAPSWEASYESSAAEEIVKKTKVSPRMGSTQRVFERREIAAFFCTEFKAVYGKEYVYDQRAEIGVMNAIVTRCNGDIREARERIVNAFRTDWMRAQGVTLSSVCRYWNRLVLPPTTFAPKLTGTDQNLKTLLEIVQDEQRQNPPAK